MRAKKGKLRFWSHSGETLGVKTVIQSTLLGKCVSVKIKVLRIITKKL